MCCVGASFHKYASTLLLQYANFCSSKGFSKGRIIKILSILRNEALLDERKALYTLDEKRTLTLLEKINALGISGSTKNDYIIVLRGYLEFAFRKKGAQWKKIRGLLIKRRCLEIRIPLKILTEEDINLASSAIPNKDAKLLICLLWITGARIGELLNLTRKDITFDEVGALLNLDGKTGKRTVRIVEKIEELKSACETKSDDEFIFSFNYPQAKYWFREVRRKMGLKEFYPHLIRKCRASYLAKSMPEQPLKKYMGWTSGSRVLQHYIFLNNEAANEALLNAYTNKEKIEQSIVPRATDKEMLSEMRSIIREELQMLLSTRAIVKEEIEAVLGKKNNTHGIYNTQSLT